MKPVIALVGRPNVGKSTLFNCLTKTRDALVADYPGLTRDRKYGDGQLGDRDYLVVDTGGLSGEGDDIDELMAQQVRQAIDESDIILFLVDARAGLTATDESIADHLRRTGRRICLAVNKVDGVDSNAALSEFHKLGFKDLFAIAASHGRGVTNMISEVMQTVPLDPEDVVSDEDEGTRIAVIGRPNVGKSTLVNRLLGEERVLAFDEPGTTRDSIYIKFERAGNPYTLIDTAGIRRRGKVHETVEKFSVIKALQAITEANVVLQIIDARQGITEQDLTLLKEVLDRGRALVLVVNKWDGLSIEQKDRVKSELDRRLNFIDFAEIHYISALHGTGVGLLLEAVNKAYVSAMMSVSTSKLTDLLDEALVMHQPPIVRGRRIKLRYAHQGGKNPPIIVIHGSQVDRLPGSYKRYLAHHFRKRLKLNGTPIQIELKQGDNPFKGRRNKLTPRQEYKKKRLMKHVKKK